MANNNETTTKFRVDISELKKAMQDAKKQIAYANSEFKASSSALDDWGTSADGIRAKLKQLNSNLDAQKTVLQAYEKTLDEVKKQYGENSKEALEYATKVNNQKAVVNNTEKEIRKYSDTLEEVAEAEKTASKTGKSVAEVLKDVGDEADNTGDGFTVLKGTVATFAGNVLTSLVDGLKNAVASLINLSDETKEYRQNMAKLETAFDQGGFSAEQATKTYKEFYAVLGEEDRSVEAVSHLAKLVETEEDLDKWTTICTGVWGTFGDSLPIEGLTEAANETSKTGKVTGSLADALNWAGVSEEDFQASLDSCTTEQERQALITNTLNGLYSDSAEKYREVNASVIEANKANSDYTDTVAEMGAKLEPVTTSLKNGFNELLQKILEMVEGVDFTAFTTVIEGAFDVLSNEVLPAVKNGFQWIIDNKDIILMGLLAIGGAFLGFKVAGIINSATTAIQLMTTAQHGLNAAQKANVIGLIIGLVAGLVTGFITLWNNCEGFRNFFINMWNTIKNAVGTAISAIGEFFVNLWNGIVSVFKGIGQWFSDVFTGAVNGIKNAFSSVTSFFSNIWSGIKNAFGNVANWFKNIFSKAWQGVKNVFSTGGKIFNGIKDGIANVFKSVVNGIIKGINKVIAVPFNAINGMLNKIRAISFLGISPFSWIKENLLPVPQIPLLRKGGILKKGQTGFLEGDGAEAVVPLEKNTQWIRRVGKELATELRGGSDTGGNTSSAVNYYYNQTINSPKSLNRLDLYRQSKNLLGLVGGGI